MELNLQIPRFLHEALYNDSKYSVIAAARRTGKTFNSIQWLVENILANPNLKGLHVDTNQKNITRYFERYYSLILRPVRHLYTWNQQRQVIQFKSGSFIDFGSAERPDMLEGYEYDYVILNEAGIILKKEGLWTNTIQPMVKNPNSKVRFIGTPKGKNKFFELYSNGIQQKENWRSFHFSIYDSPFWSKEEIEAVKNKIPELVWRQEYMADFIEGAGIVFRNIHECISTSYTQDRNGEYAMGIDLAKHEDFTVITIIDKNTKQQLFIDRFNELDWGLQKTRIINTWRQWNQPQAIIDSTGVGDSVYDDLRNAGMNVIPYRFTQKSKNQLISNLMVAFENKEIKILDNPIQTNELESFEYEISRMGNVSYSAPSGQHDDCFVKGTKILTNRGEIDIDRLRVGDLVWTRKGFKPISKIRIKRKEVIKNGCLKGTLDHPVFTDKGLKKLKDINDNDIIHAWNSEKGLLEKQLFITDKNIIDIPTQKGLTLKGIIGSMINGKARLLLYIDRFGRILMVKSKREFIFTIRMAIRSIILSLTLRQLLKKSMRVITCTQDQLFIENVNFVEMFLPIRKTKGQDFAGSYVGKEQKEKDWVYNLEVTGCHEYVANKILVHNCVIALALSWELIKTQPSINISFVNFDEDIEDNY